MTRRETRRWCQRRRCGSPPDPIARVNIIFFFSVLALAAGFAIARGGAPEKLIAVILLVTAATAFALASTAGREWMTQDVRILTLDVVLAIAIVAVALHAERVWPMMVAAFLILGVELQLGVWMAPTHHRQVYKIAHGFSAYPVILTLIVGTARHRWRTRQRPERDWTHFR